MSETPRFTKDEINHLAGSAVAKIDIHGHRGVTLCSMREIEAMAVLIAMNGLLPADETEPKQRRHFPQIEKDKS